jgi:type 1 glutamine amidotransferase
MSILQLIRVAVICLIGLLAVVSNSAFAEKATKDTARVLLVTGEDYPGHKWKETYPVLKAGLEKDSRMVVDVLADLKALATTRLADYDAVILHFKNYDPKVPGRKGYDNLARFVEEGGGLMILHFGCGAFEEFKDEFVNLAGRVWFGMKPPAGRRQHDPRGEFTVNIAKIDHPITKGMKDFKTLDELYTCLEGDVPITPVATAVSRIDKKPYPMAFVLQFGKGRVFHSVLGHDRVAFAKEGPAELHRRGCAWVAGLDAAGSGQ